MKNLRIKLIFFLLAGAISTVDIFYNRGNSFTQLALALAASLVVFYMPHLPYKLKKLPFAILFFANAGMLALSYNRRILLVNMLFLSYLVWSLITPKLLRFKQFLPITFMLSFIAVYAASLLDFSTPLFIIVFYPVYVSGSLVYERNIIKTKKIWAFGFLNLIVSVLMLSVFLFKTLGLQISESILFLHIVKLGTATAVYLPFIALSLAWFAVSFNLLFYMLFSKFEKGNTAFDLTDYIKPVYNFIMFFAVASIATFICEFSIRQSLVDTYKVILDPNILFNILALCGVYLCLISILGKGIPNIILAIFTIFLTAANYIKFTYFDEPFYPWDLYLIRNLIGISKEYLNIPAVLAIIIIIAVSVFLLIRFRHAAGRYLKPRITLFLIPFAAALFLLNSAVLDSDLSVQIGIQKSWYIGKAEILANGMFSQNYFYLTELDKYLNPKPDNYSKETMLAIGEKYGDSKDQAVTASAAVSKTAVSEEKPNVVVIMSESFWDITKLNGLKFSKDIAENVHKYQKGQIASPVIGGGTANSEFEALTGMSMSFLSPGIIVYNAYLRTETTSIATVFNNNGYSTTAIHPNSGWFYNRDKVYNYFGFNKFLDVSSFDMGTQTKGPNISDYALVDKILETLNSSDKPAFIFAVSMQNHDPYVDKYSTHDVTVESDLLNSSEKNIIGNFAQGIYDADQSLGKLINEIDKSKKPTLVYFFGDHAPRLGTLDDYYNIYDRLGTNDTSAQDQGLDKLKYYTTPFVAWSNYREFDSLPEIISPSHISYDVLKSAGVNYPSYFNLLPALEEQFPVMHQQTLDLIDSDNELIKDYRLLQYDLLFGKKYLTLF